MERRNPRIFDEKVIKLGRGPHDLEQGLKREINDLDRELREARKVAVLASLLEDKAEA